ncbi:MAG: hypothetical protein ABIV47_19790 [Roseiflexaceae bacterium]
MPDIKRPVMFCGENPAVTLYAPNSQRIVAAASYWHCTWSAYGSGHALIFWQTPEVLSNGIYTDNLPLARMLAETLTQFFPEFRTIPVTRLPYLPAQCAHDSDGAQRYTVNCTTSQTSLRLEWADPLDHKQIYWPQFPAGPLFFDLTTVICPCRQATITINGAPLLGEVQTSDANGWPASSAFLAFAETWVGPVAAS